MLVAAAPEFVLAVFRHPRVSGAMTEDGQPPEYDLKPWTIGFQFENRGVMLFRQMTWGGVFEAHIAIVKGHSGLVVWVNECLDAMRAAGAHKFVGYVAEWNKACLRLAKKVGFVEEGRLTNALLRGGSRRDLVILGAN